MSGGGNVRRNLWSIALIVAVVLVSVLPSQLSAQYFGRNKVQYEVFDFQVMTTEHFDIYYYPAEAVAVRDAARMAERWYDRLSRLFNHDFAVRKPIIFYADHTDFQQTNTISGLIGEGTGGVTEGLKNRVILPFTGSYEENNHVLGHELVHAFQYDIAQGGRGREGLTALNMLPLWLVEGMAEYLSVGREDPNTAMWLRDAALRDDLPTIEQLTSDSRYFPYRYGQALLAYIGGRWGDEAVVRIFKGSAVAGNLDSMLTRVVGMDADSLSKQWIASIRSAYDPIMASRTAVRDAGERVLAADIDAGDMNVAPSISPDGRFVIFLSSIDLFSIDLYLADAHTGQVLKKLVSASTNSHFDAISFINSAGSWSPDGRKFAFVVQSGGNDQIAILDVASRDIEREISIPTVSAITNPYWSPDGKTIVISGISGGLSDLYLIESATGAARKLTNDRYADMQPVWSPDGKTIAFVTDRDRTDMNNFSFAPTTIATINPTTGGDVKILPLYADAKNINPQYSPDGRSLYFISDRDGISDVYRHQLSTGETFRVTMLKTGVSGITGMSPAMSVARTTGRMMYSAFTSSSYEVYALDSAKTRGTPVTPSADSAVAGILPTAGARNAGPIHAYLHDAKTGLPGTTEYPTAPYSPSLQLDYIGAQAGGGYSADFGASVGGGIMAYLSDLLGNHQLAVAAQLNGEIQDIGAEVFYLNSTRRWNWGIDVSHYPYVATGTSVSDTLIVNPNDSTQAVLGSNVDQIFQRTFVENISAVAAYPFSTTQRFEVTAGYQHIGYSLSIDEFTTVNNRVIGERTFTLPAPDGLNLFQANAALVGDNSFFGFTSPVYGSRYRVDAGMTTGSLTFATLLADFRKYLFWRPVTLAMRAYHYGRYGPDDRDDRLNPLFLGYDAYIRGYNPNSFDVTECNGSPGCPQFDRLLGSRIALANIEFRVPLFGTSELGLINFPYLPLELAAFADGGVAWSRDVSPVFKFATNTTERVPVFSTGLSARANLLGYLILEVYYAYPFQRPDKGWHFGFQISPGW